MQNDPSIAQALATPAQNFENTNTDTSGGCQQRFVLPEDSPQSVASEWLGRSDGQKSPDEWKYINIVEGMDVLIQEFKTKIEFCEWVKSALPKGKSAKFYACFSSSNLRNG